MDDGYADGASGSFLIIFGFPLEGWLLLLIDYESNFFLIGDFFGNNLMSFFINYLRG